MAQLETQLIHPEVFFKGDWCSLLFQSKSKALTMSPEISTVNYKFFSMFWNNFDSVGVGLWYFLCSYLYVVIFSMMNDVHKGYVDIRILQTKSDEIMAN